MSTEPKTDEEIVSHLNLGTLSEHLPVRVTHTISITHGVIRYKL